jgi:hypothetical protein
MLLLLALVGGPTAAHAQTEPELRVLILEGPGAEWLRRVRGQLSDLPVALVTLPLVVAGQAEEDVVRQLGPLASNRDAALVAWLMTDGKRYDPSASEDTFVAIWFARSGRLFTRRLGARWQQLSRADRSGVLEIGALSVRSAVRSLLLDPSAEPPASAPSAELLPGPAAQSRRAAQSAARAAQTVARASDGASDRAAPSDGSTASDRAAPPDGTAPPVAAVEPAPQSEPARVEPASEEALPPALEPDEGRIVTSSSAARAPTDPTPSDRGGDAAESGGIALALDWSAELGLSGQLAGPPGDAAASVAAGARAGSGRWGLALLGRFGLPRRSQLGPSELSLQHHALLLEAQYLGLEWAALELGPLLRGGLALSRRETLSGPSGLAAAGVAWSRVAQLGAGALAQYRWGTHWGASLRGVLHWLPARTGYELVDDLGEPIASASPWAVQPSLELNVSWHW